jgi:hypothetical protein
VYKAYFVLITSLIGPFAHAQSIPITQWDRNFSASGRDAARAIALSPLYIPGQPPLGGVLIGGTSDSPPSGSKTSPHYGSNDFWIVRVDAEGTKSWENSYGGSGNDQLIAAVFCLDARLAVAGHSDSPTNGTKRSAGRGGFDFYIINRVSPNGFSWDRCYGTSGDDYLSGLVQTSDEGFLLAGVSAGSDGDKTSPAYGGMDFWVVRLEVGGITNGILYWDKAWDRSYGGDGEEKLYGISAMGDRGFVLAGSSASGVTGNKTSPLSGIEDFWLLRLNAAGDIIWQRSMLSGGNWGAVTATSEGGVLAVFLAFNPEQPDNGLDYTVVKLSGAGNLIWQRYFGGDAAEIPSSIAEMYDGGCIVTGVSGSGATGNKTSPLPGSWVIRLDKAGNKLWDQTYNPITQPSVVFRSPEGGAAVAMSGEDFHIIKLAPDAVTLYHTPPSPVPAPYGTGFRFWVTAPPNNYRIEHSSDLTNWSLLQTNRITIADRSALEVLDGTTNGVPQRFYRVRTF